MFKKMFTVGLLSVGILTAGVPVAYAEADTKNCGDFNGDGSAVMEFWYDNSYSANNDPHGLDRDADGLPCEVTTDAWNSFVADKEAEENSELTEEESNTTTESTNDDSSNDSSNTPTEEEGGELPDTATNNPMMMLVGAIMAAVGGLFFIRKKQTN